MDHATNGMVGELLRLGLPGVVILAMGLAIWRLWVENRSLHTTYTQQLAQSQAARIADGQVVQSQLLKNNTECVQALTTVTSTMNAQREALLELRDSLKDLSEELHRAPTRR